MGKSIGPNRRKVLAMGGAAAVSARVAAPRLGLIPKRIVELVPNAATGGLRLVERIRWIAR